MCKTTSPSTIFATALGRRPSEYSTLKTLGGLQSTKFQPIYKVSQFGTIERPKTEVCETKDIPKAADKFAKGRWTKEEHETFLEGLKKLGKNWREISEVIGTRSPVQVRTHAQKFFLKKAREERQLKGNDQLGLEYTSLKKNTKIMSSCIASVKEVKHNFDYEVLPTAPPPSSQDILSKIKTESLKAGSLKEEAPSRYAETSTIPPLAVKKEERSLQSNLSSCDLGSFLEPFNKPKCVENQEYENPDPDSAEMERALFADLPLGYSSDGFRSLEERDCLDDLLSSDDSTDDDGFEDFEHALFELNVEPAENPRKRKDFDLPTERFAKKTYLGNSFDDASWFL